MTSLLDYIEDKIRESDNPFQSDYRSEVDTLIALAFPSTQKRRKKWEHPDYNSMSDEEYYASPHFQGQGRVAESHPVASVVGPLKGANVLRKWALGQAVKPKPTTAPLAIADQTQAPLAEPLRLEGPPDLPMLTYDGGDEPSPYMDYDELRSQALLEATTGGDPTAFLEMQAAEWEEFDRGGATDPDAAYPAEVNQEYNPDYDGGFPEQGDFDDDVEFGIGGDETPDDYVDDPKIVSGPPLSDEEFYTKPKGYYSVLDKIIEGDSLTKAEKESAVRDIKYRMMSSDNKLFDEVIHDPTRNIYAEMTADEDGNIINSPIPGINDIEAIKKFKEEKPLEFTVRHSDDTVGGMPGDKATHLYFGGGNKQGAEHFYSNGRPAQAFITYNEKGGSFNIDEAQSEMRGQGNPYGNQVITKLAQQTVLNWAKSGLNTITIPTGEAIFDKYYSVQGKGLWADEKNLLKIKDDKEFAKKATAFYSQPLIQREAEKEIRSHVRMAQDSGSLEEWATSFEADEMDRVYGKEYLDLILNMAEEGVYMEGGSIHSPTITEAVDLVTVERSESLKGLKGNYQGKVKHYNEYVKQVKKALKQQGADIGNFGKTVADDWETVIEIKNPEETKRKTEIDGFPMAMLLKKTKKRQVA